MDKIKIELGIVSDNHSILNIITDKLEKGLGNDTETIEFVLSGFNPLEKDIMEMAVRDIINPIVKSAEQFFQTYIKSFAYKPFSFQSTNKIELRDYTGFVNIIGFFQGMFVISLDKVLAENLMLAFGMGIVKQKDRDAYMKDTVSESGNIIFGNSLESFSILEKPLEVEPPHAIKSSGITIEIKNTEIYTLDLTTNKGDMTVSFFNFMNINL